MLRPAHESAAFETALKQRKQSFACVLIIYKTFYNVFQQNSDVSRIFKVHNKFLNDETVHGFEF